MAEYIKAEEAIPHLTKYNIPRVEAVELSKINKALKEMDDLASHKVMPISFDQAAAVDMCINILKRNIEEDTTEEE